MINIVAISESEVIQHHKPCSFVAPHSHGRGLELFPGKRGVAQRKAQLLTGRFEVQLKFQAVAAAQRLRDEMNSKANLIDWTQKWITSLKTPPRSPWSKLIPLMQTHNSQPRIPLWLWHDNGMQRITVAEATFFTTLFLTVSSSPMRQTWSHEDFPGTFWLSVSFRRRIEALVHLLLFWAEQGDASTGPGQNIGSNNRLVLLFMCNSALHPGREWSFDSESTLQISSTGCVELKFSSRIFHWCFFHEASVTHTMCYVAIWPEPWHFQTLQNVTRHI